MARAVVHAVVAGVALVQRGGIEGLLLAGIQLGVEGLGGFAAAIGVGRALGAHFTHLVDALDRKSTRLNSSHLVISYAVFCLKKKKRHQLLTLTDSLTNRRYNTDSSSLSYA